MKKEHLSGFNKEHLHDVTVGEGLEVGAAHPAHKHHHTAVPPFGAKQGNESIETGEGNQETRRHNSKPGAEVVQQVAKESPECLARARKYAARSEHGGAEPTAASQKASE